MTLPVSANTTCDIYHAPTLPPSTPDIAGVECFLRPAFREGSESREQSVNDHYTHILLVDVDVDIRDGNTTSLGTYTIGASADVICVPDLNGTQFLVLFVERVARGTVLDHKRVFLARSSVTWPTNDL